MICTPKDGDLFLDFKLEPAVISRGAADLIERYVGFNKGDVTDPTTLGGWRKPFTD